MTDDPIATALREVEEACPDCRGSGRKPSLASMYKSVECGQPLHAAARKLAEVARRAGDADHEWRRQMEAYGFDNVAVVLNMIAAARKAGREDAQS